MSTPTTWYAVVVDLPAGSALHIVADERDDVAVTVLPADPGKAADVRAAEQVHVERDGATVTVTGPPAWRQYVPFGTGSVTVTVEAPSGCDLRGRAGSLHAEGELGAVELHLTAGGARLDRTGRLDLRVAAGSVVVDRVVGPLSIRASAGSVRIGELVGDGTVRAGYGATTVGIVTGSMQVTGAHGDLAVGTVRGSLDAKAAMGAIRVDRVESGALTLATSFGAIEVGVPEGTAAWLDVTSEHGTVRNQLRPSDGPTGGETRAEVRASTGYGDVLVRRP